MTALSLVLSETPKTGFVASRPYSSEPSIKEYSQNFTCFFFLTRTMGVYIFTKNLQKSLNLCGVETDQCMDTH